MSDAAEPSLPVRVDLQDTPPTHSLDEYTPACKLLAKPDPHAFASSGALPKKHMSLPKQRNSMPTTMTPQTPSKRERSKFVNPGVLTPFGLSPRQIIASAGKSPIPTAGTRLAESFTPGRAPSRLYPSSLDEDHDDEDDPFYDGEAAAAMEATRHHLSPPPPPESDLMAVLHSGTIDADDIWSAAQQSLDDGNGLGDPFGNKIRPIMLHMPSSAPAGSMPAHSHPAASVRSGVTSSPVRANCKLEDTVDAAMEDDEICDMPEEDPFACTNQDYMRYSMATEASESGLLSDPAHRPLPWRSEIPSFFTAETFALHDWTHGCEESSLLQCKGPASNIPSSCSDAPFVAGQDASWNAHKMETRHLSRTGGSSSFAPCLGHVGASFPAAQRLDRSIPGVFPDHDGPTVREVHSADSSMHSFEHASGSQNFGVGSGQPFGLYAVGIGHGLASDGFCSDFSGEHALGAKKSVNFDNSAAMPASFPCHRSALPNGVAFPGSGTHDSGFFERNFEIVGHLGTGSFSEVFRVIRRADGVEFALKRSREPFTGTVDMRRRLQEVESMWLAAGCSNCLQIVASWEHRGFLHILTELCDSGTLDDVLRYMTQSNTRFQEFQVWEILRQLLAGLGHIHRAGVAHLDIKPANVLVMNDGTLKIGDFGLACPIGRAALHDPDAQGDKYYMAPETLEGEYSFSADIFSLGLVVLEIATDVELPAYGHSWQKLRRGDFSELSFDGVSFELRRVIEVMTHPDPRQRPSVDMLLGHIAECRFNVSASPAT